MFLAGFVPALVGALAGAMASFVGRAIIALGLGVVTYKGIGSVIDTLKGNVISNLNGLPLDMVGLLGYLWVDKAITVIFSAIATSLAVKLVAGSYKKMTFK